VGSGEPLRLLAIAILADGHALIEDVPGVGKTHAAAAIGHALFGGLHPDQPASDVQGALALLWDFERDLCEITGMSAATFCPRARCAARISGRSLHDAASRACQPPRRIRAARPLTVTFLSASPTRAA